MKSIVPVKDVSFIKEILSRDYLTLAYDDSPSLSNFTPKGVWLILLQDSCTAGIINLDPLNNVMWQCHIYLFEEHRGKGSEEWGNQAAEWARVNLQAKKLLALTPYKKAKNYAERVGFTFITVLTESIKKNGVILNQYMLERSL